MTNLTTHLPSFYKKQNARMRVVRPSAVAIGSEFQAKFSNCVITARIVDIDGDHARCEAVAVSQDAYRRWVGDHFWRRVSEIEFGV